MAGARVMSEMDRGHHITTNVGLYRVL
jgi:hypothetical protein